MNNNAKNKTKQIVGIGVMTAIIAVLSQITIPLPTHVPVTLQTFAVALAGYFLGWKGGAVSALLCGLGAQFCSDKISGKVIAIVLGIAGLACDHLLGAIQYAIVANISIGKSILLVSVPYLVKDIISVVAAYLISIELVSRLAKTGCYAYKRA